MISTTVMLETAQSVFGPLWNISLLYMQFEFVLLVLGLRNTTKIPTIPLYTQAIETNIHAVILDRTTSKSMPCVMPM